MCAFFSLWGGGGAEGYMGVNQSSALLDCETYMMLMLESCEGFKQ